MTAKGAAGMAERVSRILPAAQPKPGLFQGQLVVGQQNQQERWEVRRQVQMKLKLLVFRQSRRCFGPHLTPMVEPLPLPLPAPAAAQAFHHGLCPQDPRQPGQGQLARQGLSLQSHSQGQLMAKASKA